jgi:biopolymer transport protein ExbB
MNISHLLELAEGSGGTLYLMLLLLLVALTVIIERSRYLFNMQKGGEQLITMLQEKLAQLPHASLFAVFQNEMESSADRDSLAGHLEEAIMHEVPAIDRSLWMLDTVITLAPLLGLFGTIIGMFNAFHALGDVQNDATQVTGGIAEALIATASGLFIAMIGLVFFNALQTRVRITMHQLETIKSMLLNRRSQIKSQTAPVRCAVELVQPQARA